MTPDEANLAFLAALERHCASGKQVGPLAAPTVLARQHKGDREVIEADFASALGRLLKRGTVSVIPTPTGGSYLRSERKLTSVPPRQVRR